MAVSPRRMNAALIVRNEILKLIWRYPEQSISLPTSKQVAEQLDVSQRSVLREYKRLTQQGWIYSIHGVGTFSCPRTNDRYATTSKRNIALGFNHGYSYIIDYTHWAIMSFVGLKLFGNPVFAMPRLCTLSVSSVDDIYDEIRRWKYDGIVWDMPSPNVLAALERLKADGVSVVTVFEKNPNISRVTVDYPATGYKIAELMFKEGKRRIWWGLAEERDRRQLPGIQEAYSKHGFVLDDDCVFADVDKFKNALSKVIRSGELPDGIFFNGNEFSVLHQKFEDNGLFERCLIASDRGRGDVAGLDDESEFNVSNRILYHYPLMEMSKAAVKLLKKQFDDPSSPPEEIKMAKDVVLSV
ncbi:MAG: GntR family transcriptional regulator [Victivallaceae bacterium]|nr:GntR family transcriptional regulator [Victivallaceae bacterium]